MRLVHFLRLAAGALVVLGAATSTFAGPDIEATALGYQTEHADVVLVATLESDLDALEPGAARSDVVYEVGHVIRGGPLDGETLTLAIDPVVLAGLVGAPEHHLLFLRRLDDGVHAPLIGPASVFPLAPESAASRLPGIVGRYAAALDRPPSERDGALRAELLRQMEDTDAGIVRSGAVDFCRRAELAEGLSAEQSARIVAAFEQLEPMDRTKELLALAVAISGDPSAAEALADAAAAAGATLIKGGLGDAVEILGDDVTPELLGRLEDAPADRRAPLLNVLGRVGREGAADALVPFVRDDDPVVRLEALHACGRVAGNVRWVAARRRRLLAEQQPRPAPDPQPEPGPGGGEPQEPGPEPEPDARTRPLPPATAPTWEESRSRMRVELSRVALGARSKNEKRASLWALAQLDEPASFAFLRRLSKQSDDPDLRRLAKSYLERPRQSLILR